MTQGHSPYQLLLVTQSSPPTSYLPPLQLVEVAVIELAVRVGALGDVEEYIATTVTHFNCTGEEIR